jgi:hypothetical protein
MKRCGRPDGGKESPGGGRGCMGGPIGGGGRGTAPGGGTGGLGRGNLGGILFIGHMCMVILSPGRMVVDHSEGMMISPFVLMRS